MSRRRFVSFFPGIFCRKFLVLGMIAAAFAAGGLIFFKHFKTSAQSTTPEGVVVSQSDQRCLCGVKGDQAIYIPLTYLPEAGGGQIVFNSRSGHSVDVTPIFYTMDGNQIKGNTVSIEPNEIRYVNIKKLLLPENIRQTNWSGLSLRYYGSNREMWAQYRFLAVNGGNNVDEFFTVESESHAVNQAATWWSPARSTSVIVLGNLTGSPTSASLKFGSGDNQEVEIPAFSTKIIKKRNIGKNSAESVLISTTGPVR